MVDTRLAEHLIEPLPVGRPGLFNPWRESCAYDAPGNTREAKLARLAAHLDCDARIILVGEAPGYQGCRYSGVAFSSERLILEGAIPRVPSLCDRMSERKLPFSEPSATIVWGCLHRLGLAESTILWNALQMDPFKEAEGPWSNRTPSRQEFSYGDESVRRVIEAFPKAHVVAIGQKASGLLDSIGIVPYGTVRHPANGGATKFRDGLNELFG